MIELNLPATLESLEEFKSFVESHTSKLNFSAERVDEIILSVEEALVNISNYAYPEGGGNATVECRTDDSDRFILEISDNGVAFNMLDAPDPDLSDSISDRPIGGLGIHLIRQLMEEVHYRREDNRNILTFINQIK